MLWVLIALCYAALFQLYWMPAFLRAFLFLFAGIVGLLSLFYSVVRARRGLRQKIGIDEQGAFLFENGQYKRLLFVRANSIQLIATMLDKPNLFSRFWPAHRVIFFDSVSKDQYNILRSFAAQQILLHRSEEAKKRFE
ncbi:MAG: hypothetical protein ACSHXJ_13390 [Marinomonas colpomeniae]